MFCVHPHSEMSSELGQSWLESTAMARRSWLLETAGNYLRMAEMHPVPGLHLEQAKILHGKVCVHTWVVRVCVHDVVTNTCTTICTLSFVGFKVFTNQQPSAKI